MSTYTDCISYKNQNFKLDSKNTKLEEYFVIISFKNGKYLMTYEDNFGPLKVFLIFQYLVLKNNIKNILKFI